MVTLRGDVLRETTPSSMAASRFKIQYLTTGLERIVFNSMVMVLAFCPGVPCSNPVQISYFCHTFIQLFPCYGLCSKDLYKFYLIRQSAPFRNQNYCILQTRVNYLKGKRKQGQGTIDTHLTVMYTKTSNFL